MNLGKKKCRSDTNYAKKKLTLKTEQKQNLRRMTLFSDKANHHAVLGWIWRLTLGQSNMSFGGRLRRFSFLPLLQGPAPFPPRESGMSHDKTTAISLSSQLLSVPFRNDFTSMLDPAKKKGHNGMKLTAPRKFKQECSSTLSSLGWCPLFSQLRADHPLTCWLATPCGGVFLPALPWQLWSLC